MMIGYKFQKVKIMIIVKSLYKNLIIRIMIIYQRVKNQTKMMIENQPKSKNNWSNNNN